MNRLIQSGERRGASPEIMTVSEARACMLAGIRALPDESVPLQSALHRVLATHVIAERDHPPYRASAMDGYAIRSLDAPGRLQVIGESAAGRPFDGHCSPATAVRISTGAAVPAGADTVVIQEDVRREGDIITVPQAEAGRHVRAQGMDFREGRQLLRSGSRLDGIAVALAAASGFAALPVVRRPRIAILCGGDELVEPGTLALPSQIYDSVSYGVAALVESWGGTVIRLAIEKDHTEALVRAARKGLHQGDLLVVIGGASVGGHDHARKALGCLGLRLTCPKVAVRPGKPAWFGETPMGKVLGLPGNPASALVCAYLFLRPIIEAMLGRDPLDCVRTRRAQLAAALPENGLREHYLRANVHVDDEGRLRAKAFDNQDSSLLSVLESANALIRRPPSEPALSAGALVDVLLMRMI